MPRIRTIKPQHCADKNLPKLSISAHLLWVLSWCFSDDKGVFDNDPLLLRSQIFPRRKDVSLEDVESWLKELTEQSFIIPFEYAGQNYYIHRTFSTHQRIDKPQGSSIPEKIIQRVFQDYSKNHLRMIQELDFNKADAQPPLLSIPSPLGSFQERSKNDPLCIGGDGSGNGEENSINQSPPNGREGLKKVEAQPEEETPVPRPPLKNEITDPNHIDPTLLRPAQECMELYLYKPRFKNSRDELMGTCFFTTWPGYEDRELWFEIFKEWNKQFLRYLVGPGLDEPKTLKDYSDHFYKWLKKALRYTQDPKEIHKFKVTLTKQKTDGNSTNAGGGGKHDPHTRKQQSRMEKGF